MKSFALVVAGALVATVFLAGPADATSPCGPNVQRCDPPEPCGWGGPKQCVEKIKFLICSSVDFGFEPDPCDV